MAKRKNDTRWRVKEIGKKIEIGEGSITVTDEAGVRDTLAQRGAVHGDYSADAGTAIALLEVLREDGLNELTCVQQHALTMIVFKIARILNGDPNHKDHWHDIAGYATLAEDRCK